MKENLYVSPYFGDTKIIISKWMQIRSSKHPLHIIEITAYILKTHWERHNCAYIPVVDLVFCAGRPFVIL